MDTEQSLDRMHRQLQSLSDTAVVWTVGVALVIVLLLAVIALLWRARAREEKVVRWLAEELGKLRAQAEAAQRGTRPQKPVPQPPQHGRETPPPLDLTAAVNDLIAGNQPYNFVEAARALDPRLALQRLTPKARDAFAKDVILENGGDALFALVDGETARLYPNYARFSATLDPAPLFEGALSGERIRAVVAPASLARGADGLWRLVEKGRVQMR